MNDLTPGTVVILVLFAIGWLALAALAMALALAATRGDARTEALHEDDTSVASRVHPEQ